MLCGDTRDARFEKHKDLRVKCERCGNFLTNGMFLRFLYEINERYLLSGYTREQSETRRNKPIELTADNARSVLQAAPRTIAEKAHKLLAALDRRSGFFGEKISLNVDVDYPLAYAQHDSELRALINYLSELKLVTSHSTAHDYTVVLRAEGYEAIASRSLLPAVTVFLTSTCHDLLDLRAELADFLEGKGFIVKVSEDPNRFDVDPTEDSIETCLQNVRASDVLVCILDRRYGGVIKTAPHEGLSATHAEIRCARECEPTIPAYTFLRDRARLEFDQLRKDPDAKTFWVEPDNVDKRVRWLELAKELMKLPDGEDYSNWFDLFKTSVDLKTLALKRLSEYQGSLKDAGGKPRERGR